jgi:hypothetical protein
VLAALLCALKMDLCIDSELKTLSWQQGESDIVFVCA